LRQWAHRFRSMGLGISRCIDIELTRKRPDERAEHFRSLDDKDLQELRSQALRWSIDNGESLKGAEPEMPNGFDNRLGDNYRLVLAIADLAGGEWPEKVREAVQKLAGNVDTASVGTRLLADIKAISDEGKVDCISSADLTGKLAAEPDSEWAEWKSGKPITQNQLSRLLRPFRIHPRQVRTGIGDKQVRGYAFSQFEDAWNRYL
jgi:hypothetical protein